MSSLTDILSEFVRDAFRAEGLPAEHAGVTPSNRPDLGQFQSNGALAVAKSQKRNPREIAEQIRGKLLAQHGNELRDVSLAGPGFVNLSLTDTFLATHLNRLTEDERLGVERKPAQTVILDYGGPNVAKPMHVGHLRAAIIGDALRRLFLFVGDRALGDVHLGDWGLPMGQVIAEVARRQPNLPYFDPARSGPYPSESPVTLEDLEEIYPVASAACKADPARLREARAITAELQAGRPGYRALWRHFVDISIDAMRRDYGALGVQFDLWKGEADVHDLIQPMIDGMKAQRHRRGERGRARRAGGRAGRQERGAAAHPDQVGWRGHVRHDRPWHDRRPRALARSRSDPLCRGSASASALRAGLPRRAPRRHQWADADGAYRLRHHERAGRQAVQDPRRRRDEAARPDRHGDGGGDEAAARSRARGRLSRREREQIAEQVGIAALKFADLSNHRISNYIFDLERFTRFEGKTGPYSNMRRCASNRCCARRRSRAMYRAACCRRPTSSGRLPCCSGDCPMP